MDIAKVQAVWTGFPGGPGVNTFYFADLTPDVDALTTFYLSVAALCPVDVTINVDDSNITVDEGTGDLTGVWVGSAHDLAVGTSSSLYAAPVGAVINWHTGHIVGKRRLAGKTFIVPITSPNFSAAGAVSTDAVAALQGFADTLLEAVGESMGVWHRPVNGAGGQIWPVTSASVSSKAAVLRSRRD